MFELGELFIDYKSIMSEEKGEEINQIKLIAVGDSGVGKTSILTRFTY
jgi:GTPase SAR1 family protein